jgi:hypothetical protein
VPVRESNTSEMAEADIKTAEVRGQTEMKADL